MKLSYKDSKDYNEILYINFIKEILLEYPTYTNKIEERKNEILEELKLKSKNYLKNHEDFNSYIENDNKIKILKARKNMLDNILPKLEKYNKKAYLYVIKRYIERKNLKDIMKQLELLNPTEVFNLVLVAIKYIGNKIRNSKDFLRKV